MRSNPTSSVALLGLLGLLLGHAALAAPAPARPGTAPPPAPPGKHGRPFTLFYGDDHCFGVVIPEGWVADDSSGMGAKIRVVFYPRGQKWESASKVMYVNPIHQDLSSRRRTLDQMIAHDVEEFVRHTPTGKVTSAPSITMLSKKTAQVRYFAPDGKHQTEAVAYVEEPTFVNLIVLSAHEPAEFQASLSAFHDLVYQYKMVAADIRTPTNQPREKR